MTALDASVSCSRSSSKSSASRSASEGRGGALGFAASAAARAVRSAVSSFSWQQRLYFCPLPQWHGSVRPIFVLGIVGAHFTQGDGEKAWIKRYKTYWRISGFTKPCWALTGKSRTPRMKVGVRDAV